MSYPIGTPGQPWGERERTQWRAQARIQRSYQEQVLDRLASLSDQFQRHQYGALSVDPNRYPLIALTSPTWHPGRPKILITGGVHGYETSGVQGALAFAADHAGRYAEQFDFVLLPCISPWGYETINRWNPHCVDPNRSFVNDSPSEEAAAAMAFVHSLGLEFDAHLDLHETTDSDRDEFRPALAARDGKRFGQEHIPDGFYTVADSDNPQPAFQQAIIEAVAKVTHIAPADANGEIIGAPVQQPGVIHYPKRSLGLCGGMTQARFVTTTEVYPDSPKATPEQCNAAQVAAICGALDHLLNQG
ncbi:M14 family metallopeptidase [Ferrimonas marina]|uniref:Zinc carboxypeptidase n=1 Tax=Ferrimonas marina TaxID=299255 RepID=A0A1M5ZQ94_9GAMM|nr:M14 family metallocarboxypeptidase [Ferrimonas marina]SHI26276.1 Zinc carboxypeptidase [Ferrimonas marina]